MKENKDNVSGRDCVDDGVTGHIGPDGEIKLERETVVFSELHGGFH